MGDETDGTSPQVWLKGSRFPVDTSDRTYEDLASLIGQHYLIKNLSSLADLAEDLVEIAVIDQALQRSFPHDGTTRKQARALISEMQTNAAELLRLLNLIQSNARQFVDLTGWSPSLLEETLTIKQNKDFGVSIFTVPQELVCIEQASSAHDWGTQVRTLLQPFTELRVKDGGRRLADRPLQHAISYCKKFWTEVEGRDWRRTSLNDKDVRDSNIIANLKTDSEQFVANMLSACGLDFNLTSLNTAWLAAGNPM